MIRTLTGTSFFEADFAASTLGFQGRSFWFAFRRRIFKVSNCRTDFLARLLVK